MKISVACMVVVLFTANIFAAGSGKAQDLERTKSVVILNNAPLKSAFKQIENQTSFKFAYVESQVEPYNKLSLPRAQRSIAETLKLLFSQTSLRYFLNGSTIVVVPDEGVGRQPKTVEISEESILLALNMVRGTVKNTKGEPQPFVNVSIEGTTTGTTTNENGEFEIDAGTSSILLFTYVGYTTQKIPVGNRTNFNVVLLEAENQLDQIVVVGYGEQKKVSVTGSIVSISSKDLKQSPTANLSNALVGRLPGLISVQNSGEPGNDGANIWVRGFGTFNDRAQGPLILVDGVQRSFNGLDPNEVESISILKDASATAVYGVLGANGVVLVTTKRGVSGPPSISFNVQNAWQTPTSLPKYLNSFDALTLYREGLINDGINPSAYSEEYINKFRDRSNPSYQYLYPNVDWYKTLLKSSSRMTQGNLNVSGGSEFAKYFISFSYLQQTGLYKEFEAAKDDYNRQAINNKYNFRSNIDLNLSKNLSMELGLGVIIYDQNYPGRSAQDIFSSMKRTPSWWYPVLNPDGSNPGVSNRPTSPYILLNESGYQRNFNNTAQSSTGFNLKMPFITEGLSAKARLSFDVYNFRNVTRELSSSSFQYSLVPDTEADLTRGSYTSVANGDGTLDYKVGSNGSKTTLVEAFLNYNRTFSLKHNITGMLLFNQQSRNEAVDGGRGNATDGLPYKRRGFVGRIQYGYNDKYFTEINAGYNGSENFVKGKRFGFFPSASVGWVASNENFFQNNLPAVSLLKFRASGGLVGNDQGVNRFLYLDRWAIDAGGYQFGLNRDGDGFGGANVSATGNRNVTWEKATKYNFGLDLELWNGTVKFNADYFHERRKDILVTPGIFPDLVGLASLPLVNAGIVRNQGFELILEHRKTIGNVRYMIKGNYSFARNKILEKSEPAFSGREWKRETGNRVKTQWGLTALGLFKDQEDIDSSPKQQYGTVQPGDIKYLDRNGDNQITSDDEGFLGKVGVPESIFGFALQASYKGFDISGLFQGALGGHVYLNGDAVYPFARFAGVLADVKDNYFTESNPDPNAKYPRMTSNDNPNNYQKSTFWLKSSDYLRLKNVELGYNIPNRLIGKLKMKQLRIYTNASNLLTWDKIKIFDPEMPDGTGSYPQIKVFNLGVLATF